VSKRRNAPIEREAGTHARVTAALLAGGAALCYGLSNFIGPRIVRNLPLYPVLISGQAVALVVSAALLVTESGTPTTGEVVAALVAGLGNAFALIAFYRAAELGPMSIVAPLGALGATVPVVLGAAQGEPVGPLKIAAIVLALAGVALAARPPSAGPGRPPTGPDRTSLAVAWALLSSLGFGIFLAGMSEAGSGGPFWAIALSRASLLVLYVVVAVRLASPLRVAAADVPRVMVPGLLLFAGTLLYTIATREGDLSVVSVIASLAPVVIVALAFTLLGERLTRTQAAGAAAALLGSIMLAAR
jgi:drug/metabolite transporter (DMT)-like permease